jgi:hypothetical protein
MPEHKLMGGYSRSLDRYYELYVAVESDERMCLREAYEYPDRPGIEGREYGYRLWIPAAQVDALLVRLAREAQLESAIPPAEKVTYLVMVLECLIGQGKLTPPETARAKENLDIFISWLEQEHIPYETSSWVW